MFRHDAPLVGMRSKLLSVCTLGVLLAVTWCAALGAISAGVEGVALGGGTGETPAKI